MMGILLGAVREKNFIKWDWDVELGVFTEEIFGKVNQVKEKFEKARFKVELVDLSFEGFKINLFYHQNKYTLWGLHNNKEWTQRVSYRFPKKFFDKLDEISFRGQIYSTPNDVEEFLTYVYGDWKTPIKSSEKSEYLEKNIFVKRSILQRLKNRFR